VAAVGIAGLSAVLAAGLVGVAGAAVQAQRVAGAADAAALAAADAASGAVTGSPCARAEEVAAASALTLADCRLDDLIATVTVTGRFAGFPVTASARAGPPPDADS
jgi:secretion/DNA translocation related TadE-like protein